MSKSRTQQSYFFVFLLLLVFSAATVLAAPPAAVSTPTSTGTTVRTSVAKPKPMANITFSNPESERLYGLSMEALGRNEYKEAMIMLARAKRIDENNPDILYMLAYSQQKSNKIDDAFENYRRALKLRPRFPKARGSLGENHIQAVLREIEILKGYGSEGKRELDGLVQSLKAAASAL